MERKVHSLLELTRRLCHLNHNKGVTDAVMKQLKGLIPEHTYMTLELFSSFAPAIHQLCSVASEPNIDSLAIVNLANSMCKLAKAHAAAEKFKPSQE